MQAFLSAYQALKTAIGHVDRQDDALADSIRVTMDRLWLKLSTTERETLNKRTETPIRLPGTMADAQCWEAFAEELRKKRAALESKLSEPGVLFAVTAISASETAAERVARRIRGDT